MVAAWRPPCCNARIGAFSGESRLIGKLSLALERTTSRRNENAPRGQTDSGHDALAGFGADDGGGDLRRAVAVVAQAAAFCRRTRPRGLSRPARRDRPRPR